MSDRKGGDKKTTNEKPVSLNPVSFEDALRGLLVIPPSQEPKDEERKRAVVGKKGKSTSK
jgi:hypothetical protein